MNGRKGKERRIFGFSFSSLSLKKKHHVVLINFRNLLLNHPLRSFLLFDSSTYLIHINKSFFIVIYTAASKLKMEMKGVFIEQGISCRNRGSRGVPPFMRGQLGTLVERRRGGGGGGGEGRGRRGRPELQILLQSERSLKGLL